jgi:hypothetical protein
MEGGTLFEDKPLDHRHCIRSGFNWVFFVPGSGSRQAKLTTKKRNSEEISRVEVLGVPFGELETSVAWKIRLG